MPNVWPVESAMSTGLEGEVNRKGSGLRAWWTVACSFPSPSLSLLDFGSYTPICFSDAVLQVLEPEPPSLVTETSGSSYPGSYYTAVASSGMKCEGLGGASVSKVFASQTRLCLVQRARRGGLHLSPQHGRGGDRWISRAR